MRTLLLALAVFAGLGLVFDPSETHAQTPNNPLMPNLGVPYTNMRAARSMLARGNRNRSRGRNHRSSGNRPIIINNYYGGVGGAAPF